MEIPNYDSDDYKNKKFKQLHPFMPHDTFRMLICGNSGSGKTNLLYHMLINHCYTTMRFIFMLKISIKKNIKN